MSGSKSGFAVGISVVDSASGKIDALNKRIHALSAPAERFNKSMAKFGEVTGITRVGEAVKGLGDSGLEAARSLERMVSPLGLLTSAGSIAGIAELTKNWAEAGEAIGRTSYMLDTPVEKLSNLRMAAKYAGASADDLDSTLGTLQQKMLLVANNKGGALVPLLSALGINAGTKDHVTGAAEGLEQLAAGIRKQGTPAKQNYALDQLGISRGILPFLLKYQESLDAVKKTGGGMTADMVKHAEEMRHSWELLGDTVTGVENRFIDFYGPKLTGWMDRARLFIASNQGEADSITAIGASLTALAALPPVLKALRFLGYGALIPSAPILELGAAAFGLRSDAADNPEAGIPYDPVRSPNLFDANGAIGGWFSRLYDWGKAKMPGGPGPRATGPGPRAGDTGLNPEITARATAVHDGLVKRGIDDASAWGFAGRAVRESRADPHSKPGDEGAAHGLFMWRDERYDRYVAKYHHTPEQGSMDEALDYTVDELHGTEAPAWRMIQASGNTPGERGAAVSQFYDRPKDTIPEAQRTWATSAALAGTAPAAQTPGAPAPTGTVHVTVAVHNAPHGVTAHAVATGAATVAPPRTETSMPSGGIVP